MTVIQLKYELSKRKLPKTGKKEVLLEHLLSSLNSPVIQLNIGFVPATLPTPKNDAASSECSSSSYWVILNRSETLKNLNEIPILWAQKYQRMKQSPWNTTLITHSIAPLSVQCQKLCNCIWKDSLWRIGAQTFNTSAKFMRMGEWTWNGYKKTNLPICCILQNWWMHTCLTQKERWSYMCFDRGMDSIYKYESHTYQCRSWRLWAIHTK